MEYGWFLCLKVSFMIYTYTTKNIFEIPTCGNPFLDPFIYYINRRDFAQNDKFSNENNISRMSNIKSNNSQNGGLEDYNNISDGIFPHFTTPSIKISLG